MVRSLYRGCIVDRAENNCEKEEIFLTRSAKSPGYTARHTERITCPLVPIANYLYEPKSNPLIV